MAETNAQIPAVAIAMPTYKRAGLLPRAVKSVLAQTRQDWALCISDDEEAHGETWTYLQTLAAEEPRVSILKNPGPHGQVGNTNAALSNAVTTDAPWIKLLHDDDELLPECLETFLAVAKAVPKAGIISCQVDFYVDNTLVQPFVRKSRWEVERVPQRHAHLAMYLQDGGGGGIPSQIMVPARVLEAGEFFYEPEGIRFAVDAVFVAQAARHGDSVIIHKALVNQHQGHETETSRSNESILDAEYLRLRELQLKDISPELNPPPLGVMAQFLRIIRALNRLKRRRLGEALKLALSSNTSFTAWRLALLWTLRQFRPDSFHTVPREPVHLNSGAPKTN